MSIIYVHGHPQRTYQLKYIWGGGGLWYGYLEKHLCVNIYGPQIFVGSAIIFVSPMCLMKLICICRLNTSSGGSRGGGGGGGGG